MKKSLFSFGTLLCSIAFSGSALAAPVSGDWHDIRFQAAMKGLRVLDAHRTAKEALEYLKANLYDSRQAAFQLQGVVRLYEKFGDDKKQKDALDKIRQDVKRFEDALGLVDKWQAVADAATERGRSALPAQREVRAAEAELEKMLRAEGWLGGKRVGEIERFVRTMKRPDPSEDFKMVLKRLTKTLGAAVEGDYNMKVLGDADKANESDPDVLGLHELRRKIRWFLIEARVSAGSVVFKPGSSCPVASEAPLLNVEALTKSALLNYQVASPRMRSCEVSKCLVLSLAKTVEALGKIKDEVELENLMSGRHDDNVPAKFSASADKVYADFKRANAGGILLKQLESCEK